MKLINPGKNRADWRQSVTCAEKPAGGCNAVFEIGREDAFIEIERSFGQRMPAASCLCPSCGAQLIICDARPFLMDLPSSEDFRKAHPEIVAKAAADQAEVQAAFRNHPRDGGSGRGY